MTTPDGFRLPGDRADLERRITAWSRRTGLPEGWLRRYVSTSVVMAMLARATDARGEALFVPKGGASMQLRFGTDARLTRDLDAAFRGLEPDIAAALRVATAGPLWDFTAKLRQLDPYDGDRLLTVVHRYRIALSFRGRPFDSVAVELTEQPAARGEMLLPVLSLEDVRLPGPAASTVLELPRQFAEKLHACTEPDRIDAPNDRVSDLYDLSLLARDVNRREDWVAVMDACQAVFIERGTHSWPSRVTVRRGWAKEWESMGDLLPFDALGIPSGVDEAARQLNDMLTHRPPGRE